MIWPVMLVVGGMPADRKGDYFRSVVTFENTTAVCEFPTANVTGCLPQNGSVYWDYQHLQLDMPVVEGCCKIPVALLGVVAYADNELRLGGRRLRHTGEMRAAPTWNTTDNLVVECVDGTCRKWVQPLPSDSLFMFLLILVFFCTWVQWSLDLTRRVQSKTVGRLFETTLKNFGIIVIDFVWYIAWVRVGDRSVLRFYDNSLEDLAGRDLTEFYCNADIHLTWLLAGAISVLILGLQDPWPEPAGGSPGRAAVRWGVLLYNFLVARCKPSAVSEPKVLVLVRWLTEILLLNCIYLAMPEMLGVGLKGVVGFGCGIGISFISGRDGALLGALGPAGPGVKLGQFLVELLFVGHAATFFILALFARSPVLLDRHAMAISLSGAVQIYSVGRLAFTRVQ